MRPQELVKPETLKKRYPAFTIRLRFTADCNPSTRQSFIKMLTEELGFRRVGNTFTFVFDGGNKQ